MKPAFIKILVLVSIIQILSLSSVVTIGFFMKEVKKYFGGFYWPYSIYSSLMLTFSIFQLFSLELVQRKYKR